MRLLCQSCTTKQIDLQAFLLLQLPYCVACYCQQADVNRQLHYTNARYYLAPPQSILTKQI